MLKATVKCSRKEDYDPLGLGNDATALDFTAVQGLVTEWSDDQVGPALVVHMTTSPEAAAAYRVGEEYSFTIE